MAAEWVCNNCTLSNPSTALICEVCDEKRPNLQIQDDGGWICDNCTLKNNNDDLICKTCQHKRNKKWKCTQCTLENDASSLHCTLCQTLNPNKKNNIQITYCWEWKGGHRWHEYPQDISTQIESAYFGGKLRFHLKLSHAEYIIDLTKLQQINKNTQKTRRIQRVQYEYDPSTDNDKMDKVDIIDKIDEMEDKTDKREEIEDEMDKMDIDEKEDELKCDTETDDKWICNNCTLENKGTATICAVCDKERKSESLQSNNANLMDLSSDENDQDDDIKNKPLSKKKRKKKEAKQPKQPKKQKIEKKEGTLLGIFEVEKDENIPAPLTKLKKKKKRKLSDILKEEENEIDSPLKKKQKTNAVKISTKYSGKQSGDTSIGAVLNKDLIDKLWELSMIERNAGNKFKANAYSKACKELRTCGKKIKSGKEAQKLNGVGKKIAAKIDEILTTGHLEKLDKLRADDTVQAINELCQIHGIGPKKAAQLVRENKIFTIDALRKRGQNLLNHQQKIGLKYFEYINKRIPREECTKIGEIVKNILHKIDDKIIMNICGSYRRGNKDCGDVDILLTHPNKKYDDKKLSKQLLNTIIIKLRECDLLIEDLAHGPVKYMGICRYTEDGDDNNNNNNNKLPESVPSNFQFDIPSFDDVITLNDPNQQKEEKQQEEIEKKIYFRRIDLKFINYKFYYGNLLYFTGSDRFNVAMRLRANEKHLILNENGVYKMLDEEDHAKKSKDPVIQPNSEKDIFDVIGMEYVEPKDRSW